MNIYVDKTQCTGCGLCVEACPTGAIRLTEDKAQIDPALCRECELCRSACPVGAIRAAPAARESTTPAESELLPPTAPQEGVSIPPSPQQSLGEFTGRGRGSGRGGRHRRGRHRRQR